jgi:hypothetical protein
MAVVARLVTFVDLNDRNDPGPDARSFSVSARLEAVLANGRRVVLLDDRGWVERLNVAWDHEPSEQECRAADEWLSRGAWAYQTVEEMKRTAHFVVGPDEPFSGRTHAEEEAAHWDALARALQQQGVAVEGAELKALPHDVELSDRVLGRVGRGGAD